MSRCSRTGNRRGTEQAGALSIFSRTPDCVVVPTFLACGLSAGPIQDETYTVLRDELLASLEAALPADGVLLVLHGAMMAEYEPDATGDVLQRVPAALVGPDVPVVGTLDLHANVTQRMVDRATALIGYHTAPHVDMYETGRMAAETLVRCAERDLAPTSALMRIPMIVPPENSTHDWGPLAVVIDAAVGLEKSGEILHASVYPVQPWMDTADMAASVLVVTDSDAARGAVPRYYAGRKALVAPTRVLRRTRATRPPWRTVSSRTSRSGLMRRAPSRVARPIHRRRSDAAGAARCAPDR